MGGNIVLQEDATEQNALCVVLFIQIERKNLYVKSLK